MLMLKYLHVWFKNFRLGSNPDFLILWREFSNALERDHSGGSCFQTRHLGMSNFLPFSTRGKGHLRLEGIKWCICCMLGRGVQHNIQFLWQNCQVTTITPKKNFHGIDTQLQTRLRVERGKTMSGNTCMIWELIAVTWLFDSFLNDGIIHSAINKNSMEKRHLMNSAIKSRTNNTFWNKWKTQLIIVAPHLLFSAIFVFGRLGIFQCWTGTSICNWTWYWHRYRQTY
jgi:hypothetical protein